MFFISIVEVSVCDTFLYLFIYIRVGTPMLIVISTLKILSTKLLRHGIAGGGVSYNYYVYK